MRKELPVECSGCAFSPGLGSTRCCVTVHENGCPPAKEQRITLDVLHERLAEVSVSVGDFLERHLVGSGDRRLLSPAMNRYVSQLEALERNHHGRRR